MPDDRRNDSIQLVQPSASSASSWPPRSTWKRSPSASRIALRLLAWPSVGSACTDGMAGPSASVQPLGMSRRRRWSHRATGVHLCRASAAAWPRETQRWRSDRWIPTRARSCRSTRLVDPCAAFARTTIEVPRATGLQPDDVSALRRMPGASQTVRRWRRCRSPAPQRQAPCRPLVVAARRAVQCSRTIRPGRPPLWRAGLPDRFPEPAIWIGSSGFMGASRCADPMVPAGTTCRSNAAGHVRCLCDPGPHRPRRRAPGRKSPASQRTKKPACRTYVSTAD